MSKLALIVFGVPLALGLVIINTTTTFPWDLIGSIIWIIVIGIGFFRFGSKLG